ncbi:MAG: prolyl oligopeptidase family serine peptidase, partial [Halobacteriaceae archaeon]
MPTETPYGEWPSPVKAERVAAGSRDFGSIDIAEGTPYWLERRPADDGRGVVCRSDGEGGIEEVTPGDVDVRTTVHEYGGGDFTVVDGTVVYARFEDQRLYRLPAGGDGTPTALTPPSPDDGQHRYADLTATPDGETLYCVRERHDVEGEAQTSLVSIPLGAGAATPSVVASGHDFYSFPRLHPDGTQLAWTTWDHPRMPWDGTELHVADIDAGTLSNERTVMGGPEESVFQPTWGPDGTLYAVSDRTGWWNVYAVGTPAEDFGPENLHVEAAEFGTPQWTFGLGTVAPLDDGRLVVVRNTEGHQELGILTPESGTFEALELPYSTYPHPRVATDGQSVVTVGAGPKTPATITTVRPSGEHAAHRRAFEVGFDTEYLSVPDHITFPTGHEGEESAHALYYPPTNPDVEPPATAAPPLVVMVHGGPTSQTMPSIDLTIQYFTTRGFAVLDVNYRGSTGYGRAYRDRLKGEWGIVDTMDCVAGAQYLADEWLADPNRLAIRGGSAGGYATLCALAFHDTFDAGASHYGVADLRALAEHTHKFEARYLDSLVGPLPAAEATYEARSPASHADGIRAPLLVLQGGEDRVVPPAQAEQLVRALVETETPYAFLEFPEERHGFRSAAAR